MLRVLHAQDINIRFSQITSYNGLSQNTIDYIVIDIEGYLIIGNNNGLNIV